MDQDRPPGQERTVIESVSPCIDGGRFPIKRARGERVEVECDAFTDGHDSIGVALLHRHGDAGEWSSTRMEELANDRWRGSFRVDETGRWLYTVEAWIDRFETWRRDFRKRVEAGQLEEVRSELPVGARLVADAADRAPEDDADLLRRWATRIRGDGRDGTGAPAGAAPPDTGPTGDDPLPGPELPAGLRSRVAAALSPELSELVGLYPDRSHATRWPGALEVWVDRPRARFSAWYEMFPRSAGPGTEHGTFADVEDRLPYVEKMGFDVLYLPPIHPIGVTNRKGPNNDPEADPGDPGSPWAIGADSGGHRAVHPELGSLADFRRLVESARERGIEVALDIAFQCSPDHPWVEEHPEWFAHRPDGTLRYAENPPKKYEDIHPIDFGTDDWEALWEALRDVVRFWVRQGVKIFRVDNPHTKPFRFWEWLIGEVKEEHPDVLFLSEAFTRPKVMYRLAKLGFTQSYTYFAWRNTKHGLTEYLRELTDTEVVEYFRPNFWPNTPDILTETLQTGGRPAFLARHVLAATLTANYGIYGPAFELCEDEPVEPGSEEYLDSEKYQIRDWDLEAEHSLAEHIGRVNRIRRENAALHSDRRLRFHGTDNDQLLAYSKRTPDRENVILVCVNLDPHHVQAGWTELDLEELGVEDEEESFEVHDLLSDERFVWQGPRNYLELDPDEIPVHIFRVERRVRSERDYEYFL
jgi:starch synthase (maltosyl-transferring)